ncbi:hypothetical protein L1283_005569 [Sphingobacterium sp. HSC-15S19]
MMLDIDKIGAVFIFYLTYLIVFIVNNIDHQIALAI